MEDGSIVNPTHRVGNTTGDWLELELSREMGKWAAVARCFVVVTYVDLLGIEPPCS